MEIHQLMDGGEVVTTTKPTYAIAHGSAAVQAARIIAGVAKEDVLRERVRLLQNKRGIGLLEAKRIVLREDLIEDINAATSVDDIKRILLRIV